MEITAPKNNVIVIMQRKYVRNFTSLLKMAAIQNLTSIEPADYVNTICKVISVPKTIGDKREYNGFSASGIRPGDTVIVRYDLVYEFAQKEPDAEPIYKNMFWYKGVEYWACDIKKIFTVVRGSKVIMQNGYIMIEKLEKPSKIFLPAHLKKQMASAKAIVTHSPENSEVCTGDLVFFPPNKLQIYQVNEKPFGIIRERDIFGLNVPDYGTHQFLN